MRLEIRNYNDIIVEWIPYNQLNDIKEINKDNCNIIYSAIWINGLLRYNQEEWKRIPNKKVILKCFYNSQNITNEFLNEVKSYSIKLNNKLTSTGSNMNTMDISFSYSTKSTSHDSINILPNIYGISQNPNTKDYIIILEDYYCKKCSNQYTNISYEWCKSCQINYLKNNFTNWTSGNKKIDGLIQEMQLKIKNCGDIIVVWIPYYQFSNIKKIGKGGFSTVYSALWKNVLLQCNTNYEELERTRDIRVALKCLNNSQDISNGLLNEVKNYSICDNGILKIYGISQDPYTNDYIIVLQLADGNFVNYKYIKQSWYWFEKLYILNNIIDCLKIIHDNQMVHHDLHTGNILIVPNIEYFAHSKSINEICISDMGLCREVSNISNTDETKVYGVMPYVAPEVLKRNPYTQAADIYSFGMIMYFIATRRQPFANCAHDSILALKICNGIRPEINEHEAPQCYIELMKKCWDTNPNNRPNATEIKKEINKQIEEAENKKLRFSCIGSNQLTTHPKACYTSRLLNPFTKELPKYDNISNNSVEVIDFTK
ncbi:unnamed protein product [Rhizophagus irregularis]|nr:unnamed protein product [Rhizophagus irregularis]